MLKKTQRTTASNADSNETKRVVRFMFCGALAGSLFAVMLAVTCGVLFSAGTTMNDAIQVAFFPWQNEYVVMLAGYLLVPLVALGVFCAATLAVANES